MAGIRQDPQERATEETPLLFPSATEPIIDDISNTIGSDGSDVTGQESSGVFNAKTSAPPSAPAAGIIAVLLIGVFVANAEGSLLLATYTRIASDFNSLTAASWLLTSYVLATSASTPLYGKLSDIFGRTPMILLAYALFTLGNAVCAVGQSLPQVVLGRVVSGIGGAGMGSLVSILITDLVPKRDVGAWRSYVNVVATAGRSLGGPIGGFLADTVGWRWSFAGQCPPTLLAMVLSWCLVPNRADLASQGSIRHKLARVDFLGTFLLAAAILGFLLPLEIGGNSVPWTHPLVYGLLTLSSFLALTFLYVEARWAKEPIFAPQLLGSWNIVLPNTVMFCQTAAQLGMMYTVPIYFEVTQNATSTVAGAHLFPAVVGVAVAGLLGGCLTKRNGRYKKLLVTATICSSASYFLLMVRWDRHINFCESLYIVPGGFGNGLVQSAAFVALTASVEKNHMAMACSSFYLSANTGTVVGLATTNAILQGALRKGLKFGLRDSPDKETVIDNILSSTEYIRELDGPVKKIVIGVYAQSLKYTHASNLVFSVTAFLASLLVREYKI